MIVRDLLMTYSLSIESDVGDQTHISGDAINTPVLPPTEKGTAEAVP